MRKNKKKNILNPNQTSFYFEDYLETNKKNKYSKSKNFLHDRIYLLFFLFFSLILIFSIKIIYVSLSKVELFQNENPSQQSNLLRRDITDKNGSIISRNIQSFHAAVNPKLVNNKENFIIKLRLHFQELQIDKIKKK